MTARALTDVPLPSADLILDGLGHAVVVVDPSGTIRYWNRSAERTFGWTSLEADGRSVMDLLAVELDAGQPGGIVELMASAEAPILRDCWVRTRTGERLPMLATVTPLAHSDGLLSIAIVAADATERRAAEQRRWVGFEEGAVATAIISPDGRVWRANPACSRFLGRPESEIVGKRAADFVHPEDVVRAIPERLRSDASDRLTVERRFVRADGTVAWALVSLSAVRDDQGELEHMYVQAQDITDRKRAENALARQALHDPVTGLPNRALIQDRLSGALQRARRYERVVAVVFGDIDRFGLVNDTLGHKAGDELLVEVADRLARATRPGDTVGRFGGDEFVVICEDVSAITAEELGSRMTSLFEEPFQIEGQQLFVTISCGVVIAGADDTPESCLRDADNAVMTAKRRGRNRTEAFHLQLRDQATRELDLETALRRAVGNDELHLLYQPVVDLASGDTVGVEALMRWSHPSGADVSPMEFIPLAEQSDLILQLGELALSTAVGDATKWRRELPGAERLTVSVNISSRELTSGLLGRCNRILEEHGADPTSLILEITERGVMTDVDESIAVLEALANHGIGISIDDFGTGYSSLEYLKRLPASSIKIDRSFVADLGSPDADADAAIVRAVVDLAAAIGMTACAEGVESEGQLEVLVGLGCRQGQGFFLQPPMDAEAFADWFRSSGVRSG